MGLRKCDAGQIVELEKEAVAQARLQAVAQAKLDTAAAQATQAKQLQDIKALSNRRYMIATPPRHGKSLLGAQIMKQVWDDAVQEPPSLEKAFEIIRNLQGELDNLQAQSWSTYSPKHLALRWKRIARKTKLDALFLSPIAVFLGYVVYRLGDALFEINVLAGCAGIYLLAAGVYAVVRMGDSLE